MAVLPPPPGATAIALGRNHRRVAATAIVIGRNHRRVAATTRGHSHRDRTPPHPGASGHSSGSVPTPPRRLGGTGGDDTLQKREMLRGCAEGYALIRPTAVPDHEEGGEAIEVGFVTIFFFMFFSDSIYTTADYDNCPHRPSHPLNGGAPRFFTIHDKPHEDYENFHLRLQLPFKS